MFASVLLSLKPGGTSQIANPNCSDFKSRAWANGGAGSPIIPEQTWPSLQQDRVLVMSELQGTTLKQEGIAQSNMLLEWRQRRRLSATKKQHLPHEARTAILAIWAWRVRRKRRKWRFPLTAVIVLSSGVSVETSFGVSKTLFLKVFRGLKNCLD